jgi:putative polysaccharide biosynthesis protein
VVLPTCFLIGVRWGVDGLATAWAVALLVVLSMTIPRNCKKLEVPVRDVARTLRDSVLAGGAMYALVTVGRTFLASAPNGYRLPVLILIGAAVYLPCLSLLNRRMWTDVQRLYTALRA